MQINMNLVELYKKGDRIGAMFEGQTPDGKIDEKRLEVAMLNTYGTDESDTITMATDWCSKTPFNALAMESYFWSWSRYWANNHGTGYGESTLNFFRTVKWVSRNTLTDPWNTLKRVAKDENSYGNGCLPLVYPMIIATGSEESVRDCVSLSHAHDDAMSAVTLLSRWIAAGKIDDDVHPHFVNTLSASGVLFHARAYSTLPTQKDVIRAVLEQCVDTDSVLSLALLLWGIRNGERP